MTYELSIATPLGPARVAARQDRLVGLWFCGQKYEHPCVSSQGKPPAATAAVLAQAAEWLDRYFAGRADARLPTLGADGTPFQHQVWAGLTRIAPGATMSYASLAAAIGKPAAVRAAAAAVGRNPLSVLVPCHRVIGAGGELTGFAGGLGRKRALLALEARKPLPWQMVLRPYTAQYADPIEVAVGERVHFVDRADDGEYAGWKWAVASDGREGWVPRSYFSGSDSSARALRSYSARELNVAPGGEVLELDAFSGWLWVIDRNGRCGWVPVASL